MNDQKDVVVQKCKIDVWKVDDPPEGIDMGGGILGFSISPHPKEVYLLFGKEQERNFQDRIDENLNVSEIHKTKGSIWQKKTYWSDLGGTKCDQDASIIQTCVREFEEESLGVVKTFSNLEQDLEKNEFLIKIITSTNHGIKKESEKRLYTTFVKQIPWQPEVVFEFQKLQTVLQKIYMCSTIYQKFAHTYQQDEEMEKGFVLPGVVYEKNGQTYRIGHIVKISTQQIVFSARLLHKDWGVPFLYIVKLGLPKNESFSQFHKLVFEKPPDPFRILYYKAMCNWFEMWNLCYFQMNLNFGHLKCEKNSNGVFYSVEAKYLEKQTLEYWNLNCIKHMLNNGGHVQKEVFRPACLPMLAVLVDWLESSGSKFSKSPMKNHLPCPKSPHLTIENLDVKNSGVDKKNENSNVENLIVEKTNEQRKVLLAKHVNIRIPEKNACIPSKKFGHCKLIFTDMTSSKFYHDDPIKEAGKELKMKKEFFIHLNNVP